MASPVPLTTAARIESCTSLEELAAACGPSPAAPFDDPVIARLYDALLAGDRVSMIEAAARDYYDAMAPSVPRPRVLDIGCGTGRVLMNLAARFGRGGGTFVGLDPSVEMIAIARELAAADGASRDVRFLVGSVDDVAVVRDLEPFDVVLIRNAVSWMSDADATAQAAVELLRPGGLLLVRELRRDASFPLLKARVRRCQAFKAGSVTLSYPASAMVAAYSAALSLADLTGLMTRCGLTLTRVRPGAGDDVSVEPWGVEMFVCGRKAS